VRWRDFIHSRRCVQLACLDCELNSFTSQVEVDMTEYIFEANTHDQELLRMRLIEQAVDEESIARLRSTDVRHGWHCLELGAGAGSIARWMAGAVGDQGRVVAIDRKATYLADLPSPPCEIVEGEFLDLPLDAEFDLAHCRYVMIHNRHSQSMLEKLNRLLRPGAFLVVEEPDFTSAQLLNRESDVSHLRVNKAICRMFEEMELDPAYGLSLPAKITAAGLTVVSVDARLHLNRGQDTMAHMMGHSTQALRDKYLATNEANAADIERYIESTNDPTFWSIYYSTVSVLATKDS
jgi:2-polyprenyl-3-methyl-5-hydroxy-6-metoxy-1,4-benzoquinol methylase